jgi:putative ABC transport system ATP-binding protein
MLEIQTARKVFNPGTPDARPALDGLDLHLAKGDFAVLIGSMAPEDDPPECDRRESALDSGRIQIGGVDVTRWSVQRRAALVARVFQDPMVGTAAAMTVEENLLLAELRGTRPRLGWALTAARRARYQELLADLGLGLEARLSAKVEQLSGGQRQSLALIMAVMNSPHLLLLDEHTAALDPRTGQLVLETTLRAVQGAGLTAIMVTHNMHHALAFGNRLLMMEAGRLKLELGGDEKRRTTVEDLVSHFSQADDRILLARREVA